MKFQNISTLSPVVSINSSTVVSSLAPSIVTLQATGESPSTLKSPPTHLTTSYPVEPSDSSTTRLVTQLSNDNKEHPAQTLSSSMTANSTSTTTTTSSTTSSSSSSSSTTSDEFVQNLFNAIDLDRNGRISVSEAEKILLRINSRLNRMYGEDDVLALFQTLDADQDGQINFDEFKTGFRTLGV